MIGSDDGLALTRRQAIIWTNDLLVYWRTYPSLSLNEPQSMDADILVLSCHQATSKPWYWLLIISDTQVLVSHEMGFKLL